MIFLGIDTASKLCEVSLFSDNNVFFKKYIEEKSSEKLIFWISDLLYENNINVYDIDKLAINVGPGSFTGIRVGVSTVRVMSQILDIPVMKINSLDLLEYVFFDNFSRNFDFVITLIDAMRDEFYVKVFDVINHKNLLEKEIINVQKLKDIILKFKKERNDSKIAIVKNYDISKNELDVEFFYIDNLEIFDISTNILMQKSYFMEYSIRNIKEENFLKYEQIKPLYIRKSFAEERREKESTYKNL